MDCLKPVGIKNVKTGESMRVRCGRCLPCKRLKACEWTIRLKEQIKISNNNWFVTLTLSDENIVFGFDKPTLVRRDVQLFMKRLRKELPERIKFYAVGEYGETTMRPHYHMLIFNSGIKEKDKFEWSVLKSWDKGLVHIGEVTEASIRYVAGYLEKGLFGHNPDETIQREFNQMSKGLGVSYVEKTKDYHKTNQKFEYSLGGGEFVKLPRYYSLKIFNDDERERQAKKISEERPKLSPYAEEILLRASINRLNAVINLKTKRK